MNNIKTFEVKRYSINNYKNDPRFIVMTAWIFCSNKRANDSIFLDESIENSKDSFLCTPIVAKYEQYTQDFKSHEMELKIDRENDKQYINYIETNIGFIPESSNLRIIPDEIDPNQKWLVADVLIWKERNYEISKLIARRQNIGVSMEVNFDEFERDESNKVDIVKRFTALALTFLGKRIIPAFQTSVAKLESFSEFKQAFCFALKDTKEGENMGYANKEDLGSGEAVKVNKSKEAMSTTPWGNVDKSELTKKILRASNYKSLVNDCYMIVESGWEEHPSSSLKYPVMMIINGELVYNKGGLSSALAYAEKENESAVVSKLHKIRKKLGIENKEGEIMNNQKAMEITPPGFSLVGYSGKAIYAIKDEDGKVFAIPYEIVEDNVKMSDKSYEASLYAKEEVYVKFNVDTMAEEQKVEGMAAKIDTVKVEGRSTEKFAAIEKEKADMCGKYEEINSKYETVNKEKEDAVKSKDEAVKEKEEVAKKYEEMCGKYAELEKKNKGMSEQLGKYQEEQFSSNIAAIMAQYALKDNEVKDWKEKSKTYSDIVTFEKDLVFNMISTYGAVKKVENINKVVNFGLNKTSLNPQKNNINKNNNDPLNSLREKYGINNG
jgi:hypothetical protein